MKWTLYIFVLYINQNCLCFRVKREILPLVKSLCQDVEYEVRTCICRQLEHVAQGIGWVQLALLLIAKSLSKIVMVT